MPRLCTVSRPGPLCGNADRPFAAPHLEEHGLRSRLRPSRNPQVFGMIHVLQYGPYLPPERCEPHTGPGQMKTILGARMPRPGRAMGSGKTVEEIASAHIISWGGGTTSSLSVWLAPASGKKRPDVPDTAPRGHVYTIHLKMMNGQLNFPIFDGAASRQPLGQPI